MLKIRYQLSEIGQKYNLLNGGDGKKIQELEIEMTEDLLKIAKVGEEGIPYISIGINEIVDYYISESGKIEPVMNKVFNITQDANQIIKYKEFLDVYLSKRKVELEKLIKNEEKKCITKIIETLVAGFLIFMISRAINMSEFISILILIVTVAIIAYSIFNFKISE